MSETKQEYKLGIYIIRDTDGSLQIAEYKAEYGSGNFWYIIGSEIYSGTDEFFGPFGMNTDEPEYMKVVAGPLDLKKLVADEVIRNFVVGERSDRHGEKENR